MKPKGYKNNGYKGGAYGHLHNVENSGDSGWVTSWCSGHPHYNILWHCPLDFIDNMPH